jgi:hypothetical protein
MRNAHHAQPIIPAAFPDADFLSHAWGKDLPAAARYRGETGGMKAPDHLAHIHLEKALELDELRRAEGVNVHRRESRADIPQQLFVPLDRQLIVHPPLHQDLRPADRHQLANLLADLLVAQRIAVGVLMIAAKRTERAVGRADVGVVDIAVDDVGAVILRMKPLRHRRRPLPQIMQRRRGV